jgi:Calpain family cysteine protease
MNLLCSIFSSAPYEDPEGLLALSSKQQKHFKEWVRPHEIIDSKSYINNQPDVATGITGYEIMQRKIGDCSVLSSLAVAAHYELKMKYAKRIISCQIYP